MSTTTTDLPAAMTDERLESIEQAHVGDYLGHGWTQDYIEADGDEAAYYRVATADGATVATMPDWAGGIALFLAEAHDAVPQLIAEIRRLRAQVAPGNVEATLRRFIAGEVDYDLHKGFECGEADGEDSYPDLADTFLDMLSAPKEA